MSAGAQPQPPPRVPILLWLGVGALFALCVGAAFATRDFGYYFDDKLHVEPLRKTFATGVPLPRYYHYPSVAYWLSLLASLPTWIGHGSASAVATELQDALGRGLVPPPPVLLHARVLFAAVAHLALFWVAILTWRLTRSRLAALSAAVVLALSFEFHYHARVWATDAVMAQFVLLAVLLAHRHLTSGSRRSLVIAAIAAGIAAGTKFPGALALAAVGLAALRVRLADARLPDAFGPRVRGLGLAVRDGALALAIAAGVFLLTTPGVLFDWELVRDGVSMELRHYRAEGQARGHGPYTVAAGFEHLRGIAIYLGEQGLSFQPFLALLFVAVGTLGLLRLALRDPVGALTLCIVPALYIPYFAYQRVLLVRNLQVLLPFLAIAVGLGVHAVRVSPASRLPRLALGALFLFALGWNAQFLLRADLTILARSETTMERSMERFLQGSQEPVFVAPAALARLGERAAPLIAAGRIASDPSAAQEALVLPGDLAALVARPGVSAADVRANRPGIYRLLPEGPWEVNFSYYPTWKGDLRPMRITTEYYRALAGER